MVLLADRQYGVVARWQLLKLGFSTDQIQYRLRSSRLHPLHQGVYAVGHHVLSWRARILGAALSYGPEAVLSHRTALAVWDLRPIPSSDIDVSVQGCRRPRPGINVHSVRRLPAEERTLRHDLPVTSLPRTLLDFAITAHPQQLRHAVEAAQRLDLLDLRTLQPLLDQRRPGVKSLRAVLEQLRGPAPWTQSELERAFLSLIRAHGLPEPSANVLVHGHLVDFAWLTAAHNPLVAECDSYEFHRSRAKFESDRRQDTHLQTRGIPTIRLTQRRLQQEPAAVIADLRALLGDGAPA